MPLSVLVHTARLPELGGGPKDAFALFEVVGRRPEAPHGVPYREAQPAPELRAPLCLGLALDASSSMRGPRFALAVQATRNVVSALGPQDRLAVVTFDRGARVVLAPTALDREGSQAAMRALDRLSTGVGTNMASGWQEAADGVLRTLVPGAERRVLVLTDGYPSRGETNPERLRARVAAGRSRGVETSLVGIGDGIDERLCAFLATAGEGRFHYVRDEGGLGEVVANEVEGAKALCARGVSLAISLDPRVERAEVLHRYPCRPEGRELEVRVGTATYDVPRVVLAGLVAEDSPELSLATAVALGQRCGALETAANRETAQGYALGAGASEADRIASERVTVALQGVGDEASRRRVAREFLSLRTLAEVRSAWDAVDQGDREAVARRLERARVLRRVLWERGLVDPPQLAGLPDVDVIQEAMLAAGGAAREARRRFTSWAHNTQVSFVGQWPKKK
ncbi:MAG: VWA domain-containing protein [Deltaproteobacteria bacterium]|nr:VWA domain-containing protein [Deltaproteobacteria bacterium]